MGVDIWEWEYAKTYVTLEAKSPFWVIFWKCPLNKKPIFETYGIALQEIYWKDPEPKKLEW